MIGYDALGKVGGGSPGDYFPVIMIPIDTDGDTRTPLHLLCQRHIIVFQENGMAPSPALICYQILEKFQTYR